MQIYINIFSFPAQKSNLFITDNPGTLFKVKFLREIIYLLDKALAAFIKVGKKYDILGKTRQEIIAAYGL